MASVFYYAILIVLASAILVGAQDTPTPTPTREYSIPSAYSVVVSTNSNELGFTYAFREYYDSDVNLWRIDVNGTINVINLTTVCFFFFF